MRARYSRPSLAPPPIGRPPPNPNPSPLPILFSPSPRLFFFSSSNLAPPTSPTAPSTADYPPPSDTTPTLLPPSFSNSSIYQSILLLHSYYHLLPLSSPSGPLFILLSAVRPGRSSPPTHRQPPSTISLRSLPRLNVRNSIPSCQ